MSPDPGGPRYRELHPSKGLMAYLASMAESCDQLLKQIPRAARGSRSAEARAGYLMGCADTFRGLMADLQAGLRVWVHPDTGEIIAVDRRDSPAPPGLSGPGRG